MTNPAPTGADYSGDAGEATTRALTERRFPCGQCGAIQRYRIGTHSLECDYCGHRNAIGDLGPALEEQDLHRALETLVQTRPVDTGEHAINCPNCAAEFALDAHLHAGECPFCGTTVVTSTARLRPIKPAGVLPFGVTKAEARKAYREWLGGLWFAPNALEKHARDDEALTGVYVPYWTYDSDTTTAYHGQRGDIYTVSQRYTVVENGRRVTRVRQVPKIRWRTRSGRTARHFDDVLVGATRTLPRKITDWLAPWDLQALVPYTEDYLAGFSSEIYQIDLDEGFEVARTLMDDVIRGDVRRAIGGDRQRISRLDTRHSDTTFKHVLLPIWTAGFVYRKKTYRFVVNGRSGRVRGERPWSLWKIGSLALLVLAITLVGLWLAEGSGAVDMGFGNGMNLPAPIDWGSETFQSRWPDVPLGR